MGVRGIVFPSRRFLLTEGTIRLAELSTVIICTCFPMMPRLVKVISKRYSKYLSSFSASPLVQAFKRSSRKYDHADNSQEEKLRLERPYTKVGGPGWTQASGLREQIMHIGALRTVDCEMASPDEVERDSMVGSIV